MFATRVLRRPVSAYLLAGSAICSSAAAQNLPVQTVAPTTSSAPADAEPVTDIVVTGSRIRGVNVVGSAVIVANGADLEKTGASTATDLLRELPQVTRLGADDSLGGGTAGQNSNGNITLARSVNLRGLGTYATLGLVNGHRLAPGGTNAQVFDLDTVPSIALDRVEVVPDGASAIYGSDAVAGVVNLVTRTKFDGLEARFRYGAADGTDEKTAGLLFGRTWESGGLILAYENEHRSNLLAKDRASLYDDDFRPFGGSPPSNVASPGNISIGGVSYAVPTGQNGQNLTLAQLQPGTTNYTSKWTGADALPDRARNSVLVSAHQTVIPALDLYGEFVFSRRDFVQLYAQNGQPLASTLSVPASNPYSPCNPAKAQANAAGINCVGQPLSVVYNYTHDEGPWRRTGFEQELGITGGARIDLPREWKADLYMTYSVDNEERDILNQENNAAVSQALGNVVGGVAKPTSLPYFNPFCDGNQFACNAPATIAYITGHQDITSRYTLLLGAFKVDGPLFTLPGGRVRLALGAEYHQDKLYNNSFNTTSSINVSTPIITADTTASRSVTSGFAELYVPLVGEGEDNAVPLVRRLELSLADRFEHYSDFGSTNNPKVGVNWTPVDQVKLHGSYGTSFRAPTLSDINPLSTAQIQPFTFQAQQVGLPGGSTTLAIVEPQGGQAGLRPEKATTWSLGGDFSVARGLRVSVNYYNIDYTDRIDTPAQNAGAVAVLNSGGLYDALVNYNPAFYPARATMTQAQFNALVTALEASTIPAFNGSKPAVGSVVAVVEGRRGNTGGLKTDGLDGTIHYSWDGGGNHWTVGAIGTYLLNWRTSVIQGAPFIQNVNKFLSPLRFTARGEAGWARDPVSLNAFVNFQNGYSIDRAFIPAAAAAQYLNIASYTTIDLAASYDAGKVHLAFLKGLTMTLSVLNLLDKAPPFVLNAGGLPVRYDPQNGSVLGRFASIQLTSRF